MGTFISRESQLQVDTANNLMVGLGVNPTMANIKTDGSGNLVVNTVQTKTDGSGSLITSLYTNSGNSVSINNPLPIVVQFYDTSGVVKQLKFNAEAPQVCAQDYLMALAEGDISDHTPWSKIGYTISLASTDQDIAPFISSGTTNYVFPTSNMQLQLISSSVQDHTTGTGIRTLTLYYLDTGYVSKSATFNLRGTTAITTSANDIFRIQNMRATTVGTGYKSAGNIALKNSAYNYGYIRAGYTRMRQAIYTVPTNQTIYITSVKISSISGSKVAASLFTTRATYDEKAQTTLTPGLFFMPFHEIGIQDNAFEIPLEVPTKLPQTTDIKVSVLSDQAGAICTCALRGWVENT